MRIIVYECERCEKRFEIDKAGQDDNPLTHIYVPDLERTNHTQRYQVCKNCADIWRSMEVNHATKAKKWVQNG